MIDRIKKIAMQSAQLLLIGMCQDYTNYAKTKSYISKEDFSDEFMQQSFEHIQNIYDNYSYKTIDGVAVDMYCSDKKLNDDISKMLKTTLTLAERKKCTDFDGVFSTFRKNNGVLKMHNAVMAYGGFDNFLESVYSESNNAEEIKASIDSLSRTSFKNYKSSSKMLDLGSGMLDFVKTRMFVKDGITVNFQKMPLLQSYSKGIHVGLTGVLGLSGMGKCLTMDSNLYTKNGKIQMKDIKLGDKIFGRDGKLHIVNGVYPQGKKRVVKVEFSDGTVTRCCEDHLWTVNPMEIKNLNIKISAPTEKSITMSTKELLESGLQQDGQNKYRLPSIEPVQFENKDFNGVDSKMVGLILGSGFSHRDNTLYIKYSAMKIELEKMLNEYGIRIVKIKGSKHRLVGCSDEFLNSIDILTKEKKIKDDYKYTSIKDRTRLIQGISSAVGNYYDGEIRIPFKSYNLAMDVVEIMQSIGLTPSIKEAKLTHLICLKGYDGNKSGVRKVSIKDALKLSAREIVNINYTDEYVDMQCIKIDSEDSLYLTDGFVPTHNTSLAIPMFAIPMLEDNPKEKLLTIHNEQDEDEIRQLYLMSFITRVRGSESKNIHRENFNFQNKGRMTKKDIELLEKYALEFEQRYAGRLKFVFVPRFNEDDLEALILDHERMGYKNVLLDTLKTEDSNTGWEGMDNLSKRLDGISKDLKLKIVYTAQLAGHMAWRRYYDVTCIGKAKSLKDTATSLYMFRKLLPDEVNTIRYSYWSKTEKNENGERKWVEGQKLNPSNTYYALFNDKQRKGKSGNVLLYRYDIGYLYLQEVGETADILNDSGIR